MARRPWFVLLCFLLLAVLLRWGSFFISVINHDESTYIVIAAELLQGKVYLRDLIDTKPIGIFWLYAALLKLTGGSIPALRLATSAFVAGTAWLLYLAGGRVTGSSAVGWAGGIAYCFVCSVFSYYGLSPNSELFFNLLTVGAVFVTVAHFLRGDGVKRGGAPWRWPLAGVLLGTAVIIKPFAAAESLGIGLFLLWYYMMRRKQFGAGIGYGGLLVAGFCLPLLAVYAYYAHHDLIQEFLYYTFGVNRKYPVELVWYLRLKYLGDYLLRYSPLVLLGGAAVWAAVRGGHNRSWILFLLGYGLLVVIMVLSPGKRFGHYQIQLHPVLVLLAAAFFDPRLEVWRPVRRWLGRRLVVYGLVGLAAVIGTLHYFRYVNKADRPARIVEYFQDRLQPGEQYFSLNGFQISYYLLHRPVPVPYVHSSLMFYDHHVRAFDLDPAAEAEKLLANPNLKYLIRRPAETQMNTPLTARLLEEFAPSDTIAGGELVIYRRLK